MKLAKHPTADGQTIPVGALPANGIGAAGAAVLVYAAAGDVAHARRNDCAECVIFAACF